MSTIMKFENRIKKEMTEGIVRAILEDAGYRVVDLGIEKILREVSILTSEEYAKLCFPDAIRCLPDLSVMNREQDQKFLIEIKYRSEWDGRLIVKLEEQVKMFGELVLVSINSTAANPKNFTNAPSRYLRCCLLRHGSQGYQMQVRIDKIHNTKEKTEWFQVSEISEDKNLWWKMSPLQDVFAQIKVNDNDNALIAAIEALGGVLKK